MSEAKYVEVVATGADRFRLNLLGSVIGFLRIFTAIGVPNRTRADGAEKSRSKSTDKRV